MKVLGVVALMILLSTGLSAQSKDSGRISREEAKKLKNPVANTKRSITQGRTLFVRTCATCHGEDGKAQVDVIANATDLTSPKMYKNGISEGEIYRSIRDGAGENQTMPSFKNAFAKDDDLWNLVNFTRSLWPESQRPPVEDDDKSSEKKSNEKKTP